MDTVKNLFDKVRVLFNVYTEEGAQITEDQYIDMQTKSVLLADMAHKELFDRAKAVEEEEPTTLTALTDTTEVNYKADQALVYYMAARLAPFKNKELVSLFDEKYEQLKYTCANKATFEPIQDTYGGDGDGEL